MDYNIADTANISAIDEKKQQNGETTNSTKKTGEHAITFIKSLAGIFIFMSIYFTLSVIVIYTGKLAQANVLPTDASRAPYTSVPSQSPEQIPINIFSNGRKSNKIEFSLDGLKYKLIELTGKLKNVGSSSAMYFIGSVLEDFIAFNYSFLNIGHNTMNELLPESIIFLLGPIISALMLQIMIPIDFVYVWIKWIMSLGKLFNENKNKTGKGSPDWQTKSLGLGFIVSVLLAVFFFCISWISLLIPIILVPIILVSILGYSGILDGEIVGIGDILKRGLTHYKSFIAIIFSVFAMSSAFSAFGSIGIVAGLIVIALIYFKKIMTSASSDDPDKIIGFFESFPQKNLSPISSYRQASRGGASSGGGGRKRASGDKRCAASTPKPR